MSAFEEDGETEVVAVEEPAPGFVLLWRGGAEEEEVVGVLVHDFGNVADFAQEVVDSHRGEGFLVSFGREGGFEDTEDGGGEV